MAEQLSIFCFHLDEQQPPNRQVHTVMPAMVLSEKRFAFNSSIAGELYFIISDALDNHLPLLGNFLYSILNSYHGEQVATQHFEQVMFIHKLRQKKYKTKAEMNLLLRGRKVLNEELNYVKRYMQWKQVSSDMYRLVPFYAKNYYGIMEHIHRGVINQKEDTVEERTVKAFIGMLEQESDHDICLCMENTVKGMKGIEVAEGKPPFSEEGYLKLPMFGLPGFLSFKTGKFPLLRDELQPQLSEWWKALSAVLKSTLGHDYSAGNAGLMQENLLTLMKPAAAELQKKMEHSIYLQQLANDEFGEYRSTMSLCVTSVKNLLHAYHDSGQVSDAAAHAVEDYFKNRKEADRIACFLLHEVPEYPAYVKYLTADQEFLDNTWKQMMEEVEAGR